VTHVRRAAEPPPRPPSIDEQWLSDWAHVGIAAAERHLGRHAAFARYLAARDEHGSPPATAGADRPLD
jgi:hypothetical protein